MKNSSVVIEHGCEAALVPGPALVHSFAMCPSLQTFVVS